MKAWWYNLAERERRLILVGGILVLLSLVWAYAIKPTIKHKQQLEKDLVSLQQDQQYFAQIKPQLKSLQQKTNQPKTQQNVRLQRVAEPLLRRYQLGGNKLESSSSSRDGSVSISLKSVPFDKVASFLGAMELHHQAYATRLSIQPLKEQGIVKAQITLKR